ncbi:hypothetical protein [Alkalihalobacillus sp. BA299]|uniref:hypothetical protein n=1 Tax=Alkalihalobacillus sp. BA299 TaxID=2815938 RepID=UPI001AD982D1|nr:hypothetical protein [Alkalihalobacillus sp. BA299]
MATFTCQILIGQKHSYDSGIINISHTLYLSENSRPAWILSPIDELNANKQIQQKITWIPTLENMLEDALVMIGLNVLKDKQLISLANQHFKHPNKNFIELYNDVNSVGLQELYKQARKIESPHKVIISVFQGSSIVKQLPVLKHYENDIEVCKSIFTKEFSLWTRKFEEIGSLNE